MPDSLFACTPKGTRDETAAGSDVLARAASAQIGG